MLLSFAKENNKTHVTLGTEWERVRKHLSAGHDQYIQELSGFWYHTGISFLVMLFNCYVTLENYLSSISCPCMLNEDNISCLIGLLCGSNKMMKVVFKKKKERKWCLAQCLSSVQSLSHV